VLIRPFYTYYYAQGGGQLFKLKMEHNNAERYFVQMLSAPGLTSLNYLNIKIV